MAILISVSGALTGKTMQTAGDDLSKSGTTPNAPHAFAPAEIDDSKPSLSPDTLGPDSKHQTHPQRTEP